jgi:hypothetical protein
MLVNVLVLCVCCMLVLWLLVHLSHVTLVLKYCRYINVRDVASHFRCASKAAAGDVVHCDRTGEVQIWISHNASTPEQKRISTFARGLQSHAGLQDARTPSFPTKGKVQTQSK